MDAKRLLKTSALLPVIALLIAAPGWAQTLQAPPSVTIGNTGFNTAPVTSSDAGTTNTAISFTIATSTAGDTSGSGNWLVVTPSGTATTPANLSFSLRNNTTAGIYSGASAVITLTPTGPCGFSITPVTITVNFDGGGSGGSTILSASLNPVSLTAAVSSQASVAVAITTSSASTITINMTTSVTGAVTNWLSNSTLSTNTISSSGGATLTVNASSYNLPTGTYQGTVTITPAAPSTGLPLNITVNFTVGSTVGNGSWTATPGSIAWNFATNSGSYPSQAVSISTTSGSATYSVTTSSENGWLLAYTATNASATAIYGIGVGTQLGLIAGNQANSLSTGTHTGYAYIYDSSSQQQLIITVTLSVNGSISTTLTVTPNPISINVALNGAQQSQNVSVYSSAGGYLSVNSSFPPGLTFQVPTNNLVAAGGTISFTVYASPTGLAANTYSGTLYIYVGAQSTSVQVSIVGGGGSNTLTITPNPISFNATLNGAQQSQTVSVYSATGGTLSVTSTSLPNGVLSYQFPAGNTIAAGGSLAFTVYANPSGLAATTYSGTLYVYVGSQSTSAPVNLVVGGGSNTLTVSPNPISFSAALNGAQQSQSVTVYSPTGGTLSVTSASLPNGVLSYQFPAGNTIAAGGSVAFTVYANPSGLAATTYSGTLYVYVGSQSTSVPVTLVVGGGGSNTLTVTPNPISFTAALNSAQQSQTVTVYSPTGGTLSVSASFPTGLSYQLPSNTTLSLHDALPISVYANPYGLAANTYSGTLYVYVGSQSASVAVSMAVGGGGTGTTAVAPTSLSFSYQIGTDPVNAVAWQKLAITGTAGAWSSSVSTANGVAWLILSPSNGSALPNPADDSAAPIVKVDATGLAAGSYGGTIIINPPGGSQSINVTLTVGTGTVLLPTPGSLVFAAQSSQAKPAGKIIYFSGSDGALNPLSITATSNNSWIAVTNDAVSMSVQVDQTGLTTGVYSGSVSVSQTGAANNPTLIPVVLVVNGGGGGGTTTSNVTVAPTSLTFSAPFASSPAAQTFSVSSASGSAPVAFTVQVNSGANWLSISPASANTPSTVTVTVNSTALGAGAYSGNILVSPSGGNPVNVPVSLTVGAAASVSATPTTLTFNYRAGDAAPAAQSVTVSGSGAFNATPSSNGNWLLASPANGSAPTTVNVSVNPSGLAANRYTGTVAVAGVSGATGSTTVTVTLVVTASLPTITKVTNAASYATGSVSPGEIITLFASDSTHPIGPATAAGLTLDSTGKVSTSIGGVQVTVGGFLCPLIYASASQVSAVVPYEVKIFTTANVLVKYLGQSSNGVLVNVATTVPGVFTLNASGTGPGAIANSNGTTNSPANPAARGDTVVVYLTGEGETSPAGSTGKVTTVASPPQPLTPGPLLQPTVLIGGQGANWSFAGEAPGFVSGVLQLNVVVPTNIAAGDQPIVVSFGGNQSQQGVTVSVK